jgi:hypothetical protein
MHLAAVDRGPGPERREPRLPSSDLLRPARALRAPFGSESASTGTLWPSARSGCFNWVIEQTMTALNDAAPPASDDTRKPTADHNPDETLVLGEIHQLMLEVLRLAHASDALDAHFPVNVRSTQPADLTLHDRAWQRLAS